MSDNAGFILSTRRHQDQDFVHVDELVAWLETFGAADLVINRLRLIHHAIDVETANLEAQFGELPDVHPSAALDDVAWRRFEDGDFVHIDELVRWLKRLGVDDPAVFDQLTLLHHVLDDLEEPS